MGFFDKFKLDETKIFETGFYLDDGDFDVEIINGKVDTARLKGMFAAVHMKILGSNNPKHPVGSEADWFNGSWTEGFASNLKEFGRAVMSSKKNAPVPDNEITNPVLENLFDKGGETMRGVRLRVVVKKKPTKAGKDFSRHVWYPKYGDEPARGTVPSITTTVTTPNVPSDPRLAKLAAAGISAEDVAGLSSAQIDELVAALPA